MKIFLNVVRKARISEDGKFTVRYDSGTKYFEYIYKKPFIPILTYIVKLKYVWYLILECNIKSYNIRRIFTH